MLGEAKPQKSTEISNSFLFNYAFIFFIILTVNSLANPWSIKGNIASTQPGHDKRNLKKLLVGQLFLPSYT